jgi:hypothetical protein
MRLLLVPIFLVLFSGCATTANYNKSVTDWLGKPEKDLLAAWGVPTGTFSGKKFHVDEYLREGTPTFGEAFLAGMASQSHTTGSFDAQGNFQSTTQPGVILHFSCRTDFFVDDQDVIQRVTFHGEGCHR